MWLCAMVPLGARADTWDSGDAPDSYTTSDATNGRSVSAETVRVGSGTSLVDVHATSLQTSYDTTIRGTVSGVSTPLLEAFRWRLSVRSPSPSCAAGSISSCRIATPSWDRPPAVYGRLFVGNGATLLLPQVGTYTFCSIKIGRAARLEAVRATIAVEGKLKVGRGGALFGCFCVSQAATSKQVSMLCVE